MRVRALLSGLVGFALVGACASALAAPQIVAVFEVEDQSGRFDAKACAQLTDYFGAQLAQGSTFRVVPRSQLRQRLQAKKKESYKKCVAEQCQIEIGRELAAQKSLATKIVPIGTKCAVMATLFDLKTAASERAATAKAACNQDALVSALEKVAVDLRGGGTTVASLTPQPTPVATPKPDPKVAVAPTPRAITPAPVPVDMPPTKPAPTPIYKKWWFWTIVGVVVAGAVVGVVVATSSSSSSDATATNGGALRSSAGGPALLRF